MTWVRQSLAASLKTHIPQVLEAWNTVAHEAPWLSLPAEAQLDHLPQAIQHLIDAVLLHPREGKAQRALIFTAAQHGEDRRRQGFSDHMIFQEYHLLRSALRRVFDSLPGEVPSDVEVIPRLDAGITAAAEASLRGYHRDYFEARGEWPDVLEQLVARRLRRASGSSGAADPEAA